jgi:hypothetical protein
MIVGLKIPSTYTAPAPVSLVDGLAATFELAEREGRAREAASVEWEDSVIAAQRRVREANSPEPARMTVADH